ncbi:gastrula zinc finger protein XlCGF53.1-like [Hyperolius riggenbachi]|uniref:gastrula zinc finger protein XlCGF53.1-like n=1 Tax=Hyperolius riggenbachi TaxID=752182 RepID=UPI0035A2E1AC
MTRCIIPGCLSCSGQRKQRKNKPEVIMHTFPKDVPRIEAWLLAAGFHKDVLCKMVEDITVDTRGHKFRICSAHFSPEDYKLCGQKMTLKDTAKPSVSVEHYGVMSTTCAARQATASCTDHMTALLRMEAEQNRMTERIFNLTLAIICLLTGESFPPVKSGDHVTIMVPPPHSLISEGHNKQKILEITRKMMELLTGEEQQYIDEHQDLYKDAMMENQPPLTSPDGSSNRNPPERCTGPLYSQDCQQEDLPTPHYYQGGELVHESAVVKGEEETYVRSDQHSIEGGDMKTIKEEEEETYVRSDQQSMEEGDMMRTIKEEEEETYVRSDQQSMEEGVMMVTIKEEEETYVRSDQQSMEEGDMMRTIKEEDNVTEGRAGE